MGKMKDIASMNDPKKKKTSRPMYEEAVDLLIQQEVLKETVFWQHEQVLKYCKKYPDTDLGSMPDEKADQVLKEANELWARLTHSVKQLKNLNEKYEQLRKKVKDYYGRDVMPELPLEMTPGIDDLDIEL